MTQDEYTQTKASGKVQTEQIQDTGPEIPITHADGYTLEDFIPVLVALLAPQRPLTTAPTFTPKTLLDCIQFFDDGSTRSLYLFMNGTWRSIPIGASSSVVGRSYLSSNQSISTTFNTKITFDTNNYANGITWDGSNNRFTALTPGKYLVSTSLQWSSPTTNFSYETKLYKNGSEVSRGSFIPGNFAGPASAGVCDIVTLDVEDYVEVFALQNSGGTVNVAGGSSLSYMTITQISS